MEMSCPVSLVYSRVMVWTPVSSSKVITGSVSAGISLDRSLRSPVGRSRPISSPVSPASDTLTSEDMTSMTSGSASLVWYEPIPAFSAANIPPMV